MDTQLRRRVNQQLNKGESLNALRRRLFFANEGHIRRRHQEQQTEQALCLTLVTNAVVLFNTAISRMPSVPCRRMGNLVDPEACAHLSPALVNHISVYGSYTFDVERELRRPGHRPLQRAETHRSP